MAENIAIVSAGQSDFVVRHTVILNVETAAAS
jgi:hypothetical protein